MAEEEIRRVDGLVGEQRSASGAIATALVSGAAGGAAGAVAAKVTDKILNTPKEEPPLVELPPGVERPE